MNLSEKIDTSQAIIKLGLSAYPSSFVACSFGKDSRVLIELIAEVKPDVQVFGIDTGYEFLETLEYAKQLINEKSLNFCWICPTKQEVEKIEQDFGEEIIKDGKYKCCEMKLPAIIPKLKKYDAWFTGLRRDEAPTRANMQFIERGDAVKINPLAHWTLDDIWTFINDRKLSYHPLYDDGYASLGCQPCTQKSDTEVGVHRQFERAGRFTFTKAGGECGLHVPVQDSE